MEKRIILFLILSMAVIVLYPYILGKMGVAAKRPVPATPPVTAQPPVAPQSPIAAHDHRGGHRSH